ncbi:MAG: GGDEF domain-containing protein [Pseudomonadota bacterium]
MDDDTPDMPLPADTAPEAPGARRLVEALGVKLPDATAQTRAALEALAGEVLRLRESNEALEKALIETERLADYDTLCPVFNRRAFERELKREIALSARYRHPLSLVFIDLDRFKLVNDKFGHATGDKVLLHISAALQANVRESDIIGRLGGDEFGVLLPYADLDNAEVKARQLAEQIDGLTVRDADDDGIPPVQLGASCGAVAWRPGQTAHALIAEADETMFRAKAARKCAR